MLATVRALVLLAMALALAIGLLAYSVASRGLGARTPPSRVEEVAARTLRRLATPALVRSGLNPLPLTADVLEEGLTHFADHCAVCHANDGSGDTSIGRNIYPRAPDMRETATQSLSDGELFSIIENGIRLTGMPAFGSGTADGERSSWALVHFIRHLPALTQEEIARMEALNPKTPAELREEEEIRRFLQGEDPAEPGSPTAHEAAGHQ